MEELKMKDLYIGKIVNAEQINKFHNYAIVLGEVSKVQPENGKSIITGKIVYVGKSLDNLDYDKKKGEEIYVKPALMGIVNVTSNEEEDADYEQIFGHNNGK